MATQPGWKINYNTTIPVTLAADVSECQVGKLTALNTADVCGDGDVPRGVYSRDVDISEDGTRSELVTGDVAVCLCAAAITDITKPVKAAAAGTITPVTTDKDIIVGYPITLQATVGGYVLVDLKTLGTFYTV